MTSSFFGGIQTELYWAVLDCTGLYWTVLDCTVLYFAVLGCTRLYWTVLDCSLLYLAVRAVLGCSGLYWTVLSCIGLYWTVLGFTGLYWALLGCTGLYWASTGSVVVKGVRGVTCNVYPKWLAFRKYMVWLVLIVIYKRKCVMCRSYLLLKTRPCWICWSGTLSSNQEKQADIRSCNSIYRQNISSSTSDHKIVHFAWSIFSLFFTVHGNLFQNWHARVFEIKLLIKF